MPYRITIYTEDGRERESPRLSNKDQVIDYLIAYISESLNDYVEVE